MTRAAKAKGRGGQQEVRDKLLETFPEFEPDDIKSTTMGDTGEDIQLSPLARKTLPISIEVKRRKSGMKTAYDYIDQAGNHGKGEPVVFYRSDRQPWIVMVGMDHYMELLRNWKK
jgi:hypothetical protein|tara:strand:+ start:1637 stop:1981 length:345 start_codon:yes stop_codon:yes gene_type:complete